MTSSIRQKVQQRRPFTMSEEMLLIEVCFQYPGLSWEQLKCTYNSRVPADRARSCETIKKKVKKIIRYVTFPSLDALYLVSLWLRTELYSSSTLSTDATFDELLDSL